MPETVLAVVQARLERLEVDARRVLRAASVFGQRFWRSGVMALLGEETRRPGKPSARPKAERENEWLDELVERELVAPVPTSRLPNQDGLQFRPGLVREAAYAMLTDSDRKLGHQLAGDWLERAGESDPIVLGEHFERGGDRLRAVDLYRFAAEQALSASDFRAASARVERAVACGAEGITLGALRLAQAEAHRWLREVTEGARHGMTAMDRLSSGTPRWFAAANEAVDSSGRLGDVDTLARLGAALHALPIKADSIGPRATATANAAFHLFSLGQQVLARQLL